MARDWWVYSTAMADHCLMLEDRNSGERGYVPDPTKEEWDKAFFAPSSPYPFDDSFPSRVIVDETTAAPFSEEVKEQSLAEAQNRCQKG